MLVGGLVAFGSYKMSKHQAEQVEQHTGVSPEELTDDALETAMDELDIPKQTVDSTDREEADEPGEAGSSGGAGDAVDELERLGALHEQGGLSDKEFAAAKAKLLGG